MKDLIKILIVNIKILISRSYFIFLIVCFIVPAALNLSITIYFEMIIPISGTFLFSNMMLIEKKRGVGEQYYLTEYNKGYIFLLRTLINFIFYVICAGIFYIYLVKLKLNAIEDEFAYNHIEVVMLIFIVGGINFLFFGLLSTIISNATNIPIVGLLISLVYGLIWMSQYTNFSTLIFNPYSYSAGNSEPYIYKIVTLIFVCLLFLVNYRYCKNDMHFHKYKLRKEK